MAYLGSTPEYQSFTSGTDYFNGDGISVAFTLSRPVASVNDIEVVISNVVQQPSTAYNVSGTTITFTSAPPAGTANVYARYMSTATQTITPSPGTVGTSQLSPSLTNVPFFGGSTIGAGNATGMKNHIINGGMVVDQRNAGASVNTTLTNAYTVDRWRYGASQTSKFTVQQNAGSVTPPTGFTKYLGVTSSSAYSVSSSDYFRIAQAVEGFNIADLGWGTANAKTITLSFLARSSLTGTFGGALVNANNNRSFPFTYTISSANTWEQKAVTITGDTTGTWATDNTVGIQLQFGLGVGTTYSGTAGAWAAGLYVSATGATSVVGTSGATFYVTGVQLEEGNAATSFEFRPYGTELVLAQRYYQQIKGAGRHFIAGNGSVSQCFPTMYLRVTMRDTCSFSFSSLSHFTIEGLTGGGQSIATGLSLNAATLDTVTIQASSGGSTSATAAQVFGNTAAAVSGFSAEL